MFACVKQKQNKQKGSTTREKSKNKINKKENKRDEITKYT